MSGAELLTPIAGGIAALLALAALVWAKAFWNRRRYRVTELPDFLSVEECAHLIARATPGLKTSTVVDKGTRGGTHDRRASATAFLDHASDPTIQRIKQRIAEVSETRVDQQEKIQVTHYQAGERYTPHFDSLRSSGLDPGPPGDRLCTVIIYLNDDYEGGATSFPRLALRIRPELGKAVLFHNLTPDGERWNPLSLHAGEKVERGEKWLSNQWIRVNRRHPESRRGRPGVTGKRRR